jgi:SAM-dependent methyltransferase
MTSNPPAPHAEFEEYVECYDAGLAHGLSISGENREYFARGRIAWLAGCLRQVNEKPKSVLDFGCGTGSTYRFFVDLLGAQSVVGVDNSTKSLDLARRSCDSNRAQFTLVTQYRPNEEIDLAFCNGVFHHIPGALRAAAVNYVYRSLRKGGLFAFWENNPWNPGTHYVMSRIPFDRDAVRLTPPEARHLLRAGGLKIVRTDFLFIFPRRLRWFRGIERRASRLPFGAQYQILCRKG